MDRVEALWRALCKQCAATPEKDHDQVKGLVMVRKADVAAAIAALDATPPETADLIAVLASWEREHGTLAAILPHEYADLCERLKRAALLKGPRAYTPPETAGERHRDALQLQDDNLPLGFSLGLDSAETVPIPDMSWRDGTPMFQGCTATPPETADERQAGADAELARVVEWWRDRAARTKVRRLRWILLWLAREIELRAHWPKESEDGR